MFMEVELLSAKSTARLAKRFDGLGSFAECRSFACAFFQTWNGKRFFARVPHSKDAHYDSNSGFQRSQDRKITLWRLRSLALELSS